MYGQVIEQDQWTASSGTGVTRFANDGNDDGEVWADLTSSNTLAVRYVRPDGINALGARIQSGGTVAWYLTDYQGSVMAMTDNTGVVQDEDAYDAFGNLVSETNPSFGDRYHYDGESTNNYTGLQDDDERWYDTVNGRWTRQDPDGFAAGSPNLYEYIDNGPTNGTDPTGRYLFANHTIAPDVVSYLSGKGGILGNDSYISGDNGLKGVGALKVSPNMDYIYAETNDVTYDNALNFTRAARGENERIHGWY